MVKTACSYTDFWFNCSKMDEFYYTLLYVVPSISESKEAASKGQRDKEELPQSKEHTESETKEPPFLPHQEQALDTAAATQEPQQLAIAEGEQAKQQLTQILMDAFYRYRILLLFLHEITESSVSSCTVLMEKGRGICQWMIFFKYSLLVIWDFNWRRTNKPTSQIR